MNKKKLKKTKAQINKKTFQNNSIRDFNVLYKEDYVVKNITLPLLILLL